LLDDRNCENFLLADGKTLGGLGGVGGVGGVGGLGGMGAG
jgi:hypothetical protein